MATAVAPVTLTPNERRQLDTYDPAVGANPPGAKLADILENLGNIAIATGVVTVANGATTGTVVGLDAVFNSGFVLVSFAEAPTAADLDVRGAVAGGTLTVTTTADNTADIDVNYLIIVDGRA